MKKYIFTSLVFCIVFSCKTPTKTSVVTKTEPTKNPVICNKMLITYTNKIKAIIDENCAGCHRENNPAHGISLHSYETVKAASANVNFLGSILHEKGFDKMPAGHAKLEDTTINTIQCWIQNGTPN